ncbi:MAG: hypothetical protein Q4P15_05195 [Propionibacteriaceae bacterium]|nr:hypothetical protein [Propionibacteriaceae bacterium]
MPTPSAPTGLIVCLDHVSLDDLVGAVEVMIQEGLRTFSLPSGHEETGDIVAIFGARARFGMHGPVTAAALTNARDWAVFALVDEADEALVTAARETGIPVYAQAMTPSEVRGLLASGATGALLFPADVVGHVMAERLRSLGLADKVIPRGGIGAFSATEWLKSGAVAACVDATLLGDALRGGDLGSLRDRCGSFSKVNQEAPARS